MRYRPIVGLCLTGIAYIGCALMTLVCGATRVTEAAPGKLEWLPSYRLGRELATQHHQFMIVSLETDWCSWCAVMDQEVYGNPQVRTSFRGKYVLVRLNAESNPEGVSALGKFHILSFPATIVVDPIDELFVVISGYRDAPSLLNEVDTATRELRDLDDVRERVRSARATFQDRVKLAQAYAQRGLYDNASNIYEALINAQDPKNKDECLFDLAVNRASAGQNEQALDALKKLSQRFPDSPWTPQGEALDGEIWLHSGNRDRAKQILSLWLSRYPHNALADHVRNLLSQLE